MNEMNNIPDANESWMQAEKMLDRHFRRRRIISWLFVFLLPVVAGLVTYMFLANSAPEINKNVANNTETTITESLEQSAQVSPSDPEANVNENTNLSQGSGAKSNLNTRSSSSDLFVNSTSRQSRVKETNYSTVDKRTSPKSAVNSSEKKSTETSTQSNTKNTSFNKSGESNRNPVERNTSGTEIVTEGVLAASVKPAKSISSASVGTAEKEITSPAIIEERSEMYTIDHINSEVLYSEQEMALVNSDFKPSGNYRSGHISIQANIYGGFNYVSKSLSAPEEWQNYLQHRENEEENIITPAFGIALSASMSKLSVSLGAEYTVYGEETNYYPYSLQNSVIENGNWNIYNVSYTDIDTAYVIGNQYLLESQQIRLDSMYNSNLDTIEEYKYDQAIAEKNGVNRITYIEMPVMFSYNLVRGRAGVGISVGVAPGWLTSRSGYYLRTDGRGVESLEEIQSFRKFMLNGRAGIDLYYRMNARMSFTLRPQMKTNLNSIFEDSYGVKQKYTSTGVLFGVSWLLN